MRKVEPSLMVKKDGMILEPFFGKGNRFSKSPSLQEIHRDSKAFLKGRWDSRIYFMNTA